MVCRVKKIKKQTTKPKKNQKKTKSTLIPGEWRVEKCRPERYKVEFQSRPPLRPWGIDSKDLNSTKKNQNWSTVLWGSWTHGIGGLFTHKGQINQEFILATKLQFGFSRSFFSPNYFKKQNISATHQQLEDVGLSCQVALRSKWEKALLLLSACTHVASMFLDFHWQQREIIPIMLK